MLCHVCARTQPALSNMPFPFTSDTAAPCKIKLSCQLLIHRPRDLDNTRYAVRLHAARHVNGVAPEVIDELGRSNYACHHGTGIDADADGQVRPGFRREIMDVFEYLRGRA